MHLNFIILWKILFYITTCKRFPIWKCFKIFRTFLLFYAIQYFLLFKGAVPLHLSGELNHLVKTQYAFVYPVYQQQGYIYLFPPLQTCIISWVINSVILYLSNVHHYNQLDHGRLKIWKLKNCKHQFTYNGLSPS